MKIIKLLPGKEPERIEVENTLEALQKEVEGRIEAVVKVCRDCDVQQVAATLQALKERKENGTW